MSFLQKLFGREEKAAAPPPTAELDPPCPHVTLIPRWDTNEDIGAEEKVARYTCEGCGSEFSREEGQGLLAAEKERLQDVLG